MGNWISGTDNTAGGMAGGMLRNASLRRIAKQAEAEGEEADAKMGDEESGATDAAEAKAKKKAKKDKALEDFLVGGKRARKRNSSTKMKIMLSCMQVRHVVVGRCLRRWFVALVVLIVAALWLRSSLDTHAVIAVGCS